jgi:C1A family cysteine protease
MSFIPVICSCISTASSIEKKITRTFIHIDKFIENKIKRKLKPLTIALSPESENPIYFSLEEKQNFVYDQEDLGSCTANAFCGAFRIHAKYANKFDNFIPSRLFFYYNERKMEDTEFTDAGADVEDGIHFTQTYGICNETTWPYDVTQFAVEPSQHAYEEALQYKVQSYGIVEQNDDLLKNIKSLIQQKIPVLIGMRIFDSFESYVVASTGVVPLPNVEKEECLGGHELCIIGYNDINRQFIVLNSWGENWGSNGKCFIPYDYISDSNLTVEVTSFYL